MPIVPFLAESSSIIRILYSNNQDGHEYMMKDLADGHLPVVTGILMIVFPLIYRQMSFKFAFVLNYVFIGLYLSLLTIVPDKWFDGIVLFVMNGYVMISRIAIEIDRREKFLSNQELQETNWILS